MIISVLKRIIIIWFLFFLILACNHRKKTYQQRYSECFYDKGIDEKIFFSFDKSRFNKQLILQHFNSNIIVDSSIDKRSDGEEVLAYTIKDDSSRFVFSLDDYSQGKTNFNIAFFELKSNIFKFDNGININMSRADFFKLLKIDEIDCDTFDIDLDSANYYLRFGFEKDKLVLIKTEYINM